ncbi:hypothetical protein Hanom_Chr14g01312831 [Helianthus anomalus]
MRYGEVWIGLGAFLDMWNGSPPPLKLTPMGYGGAWVGHEFALTIESLPCHLLARPTPGFKPTPMRPRPKPTPQHKPQGGGLDVFSQPTPQSKPHTPYKKLRMSRQDDACTDVHFMVG